MSDKNPNINKKKKPALPTPSPRPGLQLWVLAGLLVFLFGVMWVNNLNSPAKINQQRFEQMLAVGDVREITIINEKMVEVMLKPEALAKSEYRQELTRRTPFGATGAGAQFYFPVVDAKLFQEDLDRVQKALPPAQKLPLNID